MTLLRCCKSGTYLLRARLLHTARSWVGYDTEVQQGMTAIIMACSTRAAAEQPYVGHTGMLVCYTGRMAIARLDMV